MENSKWKGYSVHGDVKELDLLIVGNDFINIDEEDVTLILSKDGENYVAAGSAPGLEEAFNLAVKNLGCHPEKIRDLLIGFRYGSTPPGLKELGLTFSITEQNPNVSVRWGMGKDDFLGEGFKVILLASI